jgi:NAD(P)H dehydrogenase (quinone)
VTNPAIIYYSTTGHGTTMAKQVAAAAEAAGADVRGATVGLNAKSTPAR